MRRIGSLAFLLSACAAGTPVATPCTAASECGPGGRCVDGVCIAGERCAVSSECSVPPCGRVECVAGACERTADDRDCGAGRVCNVQRGCVLVADAGPGPCLEPHLETCDGTDEDCDGRTDEGSELCAASSGTAICVDGECRVGDCPTGTADCDARADNGCEADLGSTSSCGACGVSCSGAAALCARDPLGVARCVDACASPTPLACGGTCVDPTSDPAHCGACNTSCSTPHRPGTCVASACVPGACEPGYADCNGEPSDGCETSLSTASDCGGCGVRCETPGACEALPASCAAGTCAYAAAASSVECRPAAGACDLAETCGAGGACGADARAPAGTQCRPSACSGDTAETCDGSGADCPPACGCTGETCCGGTGCGAGLSCRAGTCLTCTLVPPTWTGAVGTPGSSWIGSVSASGNTLTFTDQSTMTPHTFSVSGPITLSGAFTPTSNIFSSVVASGNTLTFTDWAGTESMVITVSGATVSGSFVPPVSCSELFCFNGYLSAIASSGASLVLSDGVGATSAITFSAVESCM